MATHWQMLLERIAADPTQQLCQLSPLTAAEAQVMPENRLGSKADPAARNNYPKTLQGAVAPTAPRDALESKLVMIWQKVLGAPSLGISDNFFDLGGHSLTALRLFAEVRKLTGKHLPLATLFQAPTVSQLANMLRDSGWNPPWSSLVPIQPGGTKPRFYCVHGGGGNVLLFRNLARDLGMDYPFYALQSRGLNGAGDYLTSVEAMAEAYLREIREFQPEGPYCLGGFCMGGQVAFHMAKLLIAAGQKVNLLVLFDTFNHNGIAQTPSLAQRFQYLRQKASFHWQNISSLSPGDRRSYLREKMREVRAREWDRLSDGLRNALLPERFRRRAGAKVFLETINDDAGFTYQPTPYPGQVTLIRPKRNYSFIKDPEMGWASLATGLSVIELPINPGAMFNEPFVQLLAQRLRACLDCAEAARPPG
jgi:thioesterase domain-containing protein